MARETFGQPPPLNLRSSATSPTLNLRTLNSNFLSPTYSLEGGGTLEASPREIEHELFNKENIYRKILMDAGVVLTTIDWERSIKEEI